MEQLSIKRPRFFYNTAPQPCPYLDNRVERKIITEINGPDAIQLNDRLSRAGFRRSHSICYAPVCETCSACLPMRVRVNEFKFVRTLGRIFRKNSDLRARLLPARATLEQYALFRQYEEQRHGESDMAMMDYEDYRIMVEDTPVDTFMLEVREPEHGKLIGVMLSDRMDDGLSAVYSFFKSGAPKRSLGTFLVLRLIEQARLEGLPYVYMGYLIYDCAKMSYKARFGPYEIFGNDGWKIVSEAP